MGEARRAILMASVAAILVAGGPARALEGSLTEKSYEDNAVGYSIRPVRGWESLPRKNPDDPTAGNQVGGWYSTREEFQGARLEVHAFGTFFPPETRAVATEPSMPEKPAGGTDEGDGAGEGEDPEGGEPEGGDPEGGEGEGGETKPQGPTTLEEMFGARPTSFQGWIDRIKDGLEKQAARNPGAPRGRFEMDIVKTMKFGSDEGALWEGTYRAGREETSVYAASVRRGDFEVAALFQCPAEESYLRRFRSAYVASLKTLRILSQREMEKARDDLRRRMEEAGGGDAAWLEQVKDRIPPGWKYRRTPHYLIVYDKSLDSPPPKGNPALAARIEKQLENIRRDVYEVLFPAEAPVTAISVVKITQDPQQYAAYGAPAGSAGYWSWPSRELVFFYTAQAGDLTLDVLNHEAFHQYIFYSVGQVSPHSWFNEGHGDFFAGYNMKEGKFTQAKFDRRVEKIRTAIEQRTFVPLKEFLRYSQAQYYQRGGDPRKGGDVLQNYAQGWSLVWFLRTTKEEKYQGVLERYFDTLKAAVREWRTTEDAAAAAEKRKPLPTFLFPQELNDAAREKALEAAFGGIDLDRMEADWIASKPY